VWSVGCREYVQDDELVVDPVAPKRVRHPLRDLSQSGPRSVLARSKKNLTNKERIGAKWYQDADSGGHHVVDPVGDYS